ncbi:Anti-sigma regulatory factor (Ser/Thr protein kinase) [Micromonospora matsumotoense]|uniref:Anti-sigma regulatory factor (Ser/Thr protein kinase) n=1 Tax=Micromonospora matsumotoense TaxID=121616 RepID=A0A1C5AD08_9ACTN|nr:ATP-binding protein [Micromonospora matsumotoense]SCF43125.1 Anti-sigma regulatory factor (Ser/Thr protein kinase) [Micromonospora matsumotoense]
MTGGRDVGASCPDPTAGRRPADDPPGMPSPAGPMVRDAPVVFRAALAADPAQLSPTREALRSWLAGAGVDEADLEVVLIAVGEACANAIEHGCRFASEATVTVRAGLHAGRLEIEVSDTGGWREGPSGGRDRGRGRLIMARLMDEAQLDGTPGGTTVRLVKHLSGRR